MRLRISEGLQWSLQLSYTLGGANQELCQGHAWGILSTEHLAPFCTDLWVSKSSFPFSRCQLPQG